MPSNGIVYACPEGASQACFIVPQLIHKGYTSNRTQPRLPAAKKAKGGRKPD